MKKTHAYPLMFVGDQALESSLTPWLQVTEEEARRKEKKERLAAQMCLECASLVSLPLLTDVN